ncbi:dynamin-binding protein [Mytilus galloprovincialis]|uniref:Dynamin-binding protein n=1 Tax=Mytilus galloprovincialis TaxID=29158 RepID=A0A8B6E4Z5_MYTGA|nr:dynamin-binding protein [Mytilus galloprovincialis]
MKPSSSEYIGHYVRAVYDFETQHPKEINLKKGDIIKVTKIIDGNWLHGLNRNVEGNFPSSFIEKISMPVVTPGQIVFGAIENFPAQQDGDLEFRKGMVIEGTERIDDNWWRGKIGTQSGIFPTTHVIELEVPQALRDRAASVHSSEPMFAQALCDSTAQLDEELSFHAGDIVTVTEIIDDDWYYGELGDKKGIFLSSCVELMQDTYALAEHAEHNQSKESLQNTIDNSKVLTRQTAVDQPVSLSNPDNVQKIDLKGGNIADVNANISNQTESYSDFSSGLSESSEYNTQFSYTNENTRSLESSISPYGMTLFSFVGESPNELSFNENEIVYLIQHVDAQWIEGQIDDKIGIFPANFVSIVVDCPYAYDIDQDINEAEEIEGIAMDIENESSPQNSVTIGDGFSQRLETEIELSPLEQYGLVLYDFTAEVDGDLSVFAGETLEIVKNVDCNWVQAKNDHGKIGMIPKQFLDIVDEPQNLPPCDTKIISSSDSDFSSKKCDLNICDKLEPKSVEIDAQSSKPKKNDLGPKKEPLPSEIYKIPTYTPCSKTGSFRKPSLPTKPKPSLAPKPILKPKPLSPKPVSVLKNKSGPSKTVNSAITITTTTAKDDQSLNKSLVERFVTEDEAASQIPKSKSSTDVSILKNGTKNEENRISIDCSAAFGEIDSIVNTEMEKEIKKSESSNIDFDDSGENRIAEIKNKRTVSFSKPNHIENKKRHSVNFPLSNFRTMDCGMNKRSNRQSLAIPLKPQIEQKSTKVGYSTFFTDFSSEEISPVKAVPMRKPPPPPQKTESFDFTRKPSLRKPPPPRPSVPKDRPLSPPRPEEGPVPTQKSKKAEKTKKNQEKRPRPHITPTRPAPQRPVPGQPARQPPPKPPVSDNLMSFSPTKEEPEDTNFEIIEDLKQRIKEVETDLERYKKNKEELEIQHTEDGNSSEVHDNIEFYIANIEGLTNELDSLKENLHKVLPSSELDEVARKMAEEERKKEEEQRKEEDRKKAEEQRIKRREKREKVIDELIQTERDFLHGLHLCIETFVSPTADKGYNQKSRDGYTHTGSYSRTRRLKDLGGERRFAASVARRLQSMGALTKGDRRAATGADLGEFNYDTPYGRNSLRIMYQHICSKKLVPGIDLHEITEKYNLEQFLPLVQESLVLMGLADIENIKLGVALKDSDAGDVSKFLNRILGLSVEKQNLMFNYFTEVLKLTIQNARKEGRYNEGMLDITASSVEMIGEPKEIFSELNKSHTKTRLIELNIDRGMSWDMAVTRLESHTGPHDGFYISKRDMWGRKLCILATQKETSSHLFRISRPNTGLSMFEEEKAELMHKYVPLAKDKAEKLWKELYSQSKDQCIHGKSCKHSKTCKVGSRCYRMHLLCGSIVSHMTLLEATLNKFAVKLNLSKSEATIRVVRVKLNNGERVVGVRYPEVLVRQVEKVLTEQNRIQAHMIAQDDQLKLSHYFSNQSSPVRSSSQPSGLNKTPSSQPDISSSPSLATGIRIKTEPGLDVSQSPSTKEKLSDRISQRFFTEPITPVCLKSQRKAFRPPVTIMSFFKPSVTTSLSGSLDKSKNSCLEKTNISKSQGKSNGIGKNTNIIDSKKDKSNDHLNNKMPKEKYCVLVYTSIGEGEIRNHHQYQDLSEIYHRLKESKFDLEESIDSYGTKKTEEKLAELCKTEEIRDDDSTSVSRVTILVGGCDSCKNVGCEGKDTKKETKGKKRKSSTPVVPSSKRRKQSSIMNSFAKSACKKEESIQKEKTCPICQKKFDLGTSNDEINEHIDNCLIE